LQRHAANPAAFFACGVSSSCPWSSSLETVGIHANIHRHVRNVTNAIVSKSTSSAFEVTAAADNDTLAHVIYIVKRAHGDELAGSIATRSNGQKVEDGIAREVANAEYTGNVEKKKKKS
jgi:hypothetical protein